MALETVRLPHRHASPVSPPAPVDTMLRWNGGRPWRHGVSVLAGLGSSRKLGGGTEATVPSGGEPRMAPPIGNARYSQGALGSPINDVRLVGVTLPRCHFTLGSCRP